LRKEGEVPFFEFRGRGRSQDHVLAIRVKLDGQNCQLIYRLPTAAS
jgi:hypothetical protein